MEFGDRQSPRGNDRTSTPPAEEEKDRIPTPPTEEAKDRIPTPPAEEVEDARNLTSLEEWRERDTQSTQQDDTMPYPYPKYRDDPDAEAHVYSFLQTWEANHVS